MNIIGNKGFTLLICAINNNNTEIAKLLINKSRSNENINLYVNNKIKVIGCINGEEQICECSALMNAVQYSATEIIRELLRYPYINVNEKINGMTILLHAVNHNQDEIIELLLKLPNININEQDKNGNSALILSSMKGYKKIVELLLKYPNININLKNKNGLNALMLSVFNGYMDILEKLIENGADIEVKDDNGCTPLILASRLGQTEIASKLIENGANINAKGKLSITKNNVYYIDREKGTPMLYAILCGKIGIVKLLIENGVEIKVKGSEFYLFRAIEKDQKEILDILIKKGADPNSIMYDLSVLMYSVKLGKKEIVKMLLKNPNIDINLQNSEGFTALMFAALNGQKEIVQFLLEQPDIEIDIGNKHGFTALMGAIEADQKEIVEMLLECPDVNIERENGFGHTPLTIAVNHNHIGMVEFLLEKGASIHKKKRIHSTIICAVLKNNIDMIKLLLKKGVNINEKGMYRITSLDVAIVNGNEDIVKLLLEKGANVNVSNKYGDTALMAAVQQNFIRIVEILLNWPGIDINAKNCDNETAMDIALTYGNKKIITLIKNKMEKNLPKIDENDNKNISYKKKKLREINNKFMNAATNGDIETLNKLFDMKDANDNTIIDINYRNQRGDTILINAAKNNKHEVVKLLLITFKADIDLKDANGNNALIKAAEYGSFDVVEELISQGAKINSNNQEKKTALMVAAENGHIKIVRLLIKKGAKISLKDKYEKSAIDLVNIKIEKIRNTSSINMQTPSLDDYISIKKILESHIQLFDHMQLIDQLVEIITPTEEWEIVLKGTYTKDLEFWKKNNSNIYNKIQNLINEIRIDPFRGLGRVEKLIGDMNEYYSRRIDKQNRLIYEIDGEKVFVISCRGHYEQEKRNN